MIKSNSRERKSWGQWVCAPLTMVGWESSPREAEPLNCSTWKKLADWDTCTEFRVKRDGIKLVSIKSGRQMKIWKVNWNWSQDEQVFNILKALKRSFSSTPIWNLPFRTRMNVSATHQKKQEENKHRGHVPDLEHESIWTGKHTAPRQQCHYLRSHCLPVSSLTTKSLSTSMACYLIPTK